MPSSFDLTRPQLRKLEGVGACNEPPPGLLETATLLSSSVACDGDRVVGRAPLLAVDVVMDGSVKQARNLGRRGASALRDADSLLFMSCLFRCRRYTDTLRNEQACLLSIRIEVRWIRRRNLLARFGWLYGSEHARPHRSVHHIESSPGTLTTPT